VGNGSERYMHRRRPRFGIGLHTRAVVHDRNNAMPCHAAQRTAERLRNKPAEAYQGIKQKPGRPTYNGKEAAVHVHFAKWLSAVAKAG
jgi:hypothetical protein